MMSDWSVDLWPLSTIVMSWTCVMRQWDVMVTQNCATQLSATDHGN